MSKFKVGVEYKFINEDAESEYSSRYSINKDFVDAVNAHGGTFLIEEYDHKNNRVVSVMFTDGTTCDEVLDEDNIIFESEYKYFTEVGNSVEAIPNELIMNLSIHNRGQAIAAIAALQSAYQC